MSTKKYKQKLLKYRICSVARIVACISFLVLTVIGVSSLVRAMSLTAVENQNGIPASWKVASLGSPSTIDIPITYWDQRVDACDVENRQFEWSECRLYAKGIVQNVVKSTLGSDGLPVPTYTNSTDAWKAYHDVFTANVTGNDPVQVGDNFYRWFHEAYDADGKQLSKRYDRKVTFRLKESTKNTYEYGSKGTFPLDDVDFSDGDFTNANHNFHFTAHMQIPMKIAADGSEQFWFSGDDDVWVFLNGQLVLDLGGLHSDTQGSFTIDANGNVISTVDNVADAACRQQKVYNPKRIGYDTYNSQVDNACPRSPKTTTISTGFQPGDIVNLDFFYAERSTSESNTRITISNMEWPISAGSNVEGHIEGKLEGSESNIVKYVTSVSNRDPQFELQLERMATYIHDQSSVTREDGTTETFTNSGFLPLDETTLYYTKTLDDDDSWQPVKVSAPSNTTDGFKLETPLTMSRSGQPGDTIYFRYLAETSEYSGTVTNRTSYYTNMNGAAGVTYDHIVLPYTGKTDTGEDPQPEPTYNVDVTYRIDFGDEEPDPEIVAKTPKPVHQEKKEGDTYNIPSPDLDGYTPDKKTVSGIVETSDVTIEVVYTKTPTEPVRKEHTLTIKYVDEAGNTVADDFTGTYYEGDPYSVSSPEVKNYTPDTEIVTGTMPNEDTEIIVTYTRKNTPTVPVVPDNPTPDVPSEPEDNLPTIPVVPGDDDLIYVGPLGEVTYVPNTGIVSEVLAPLFTQYFAEAILSQWFVMTVLLIFAASFAIYFSMRKYLNFKNQTVKATASAGQANSKSGAKTTKPAKANKSTAKSTAKVARTAAKATTKSHAKANTRKR